MTTFGQLSVGTLFVFADSPSLEHPKVKTGYHRWGYPDYQSSPPQIIRVPDPSREVIQISCSLDPDEDPIDYIRAGGDAPCPECGRKYFDHPYSHHRGCDDRPFLKRACDGRLLKL